jgi:hypothetical protein
MPAQEIQPIIRRPSQAQLPKTSDARDIANYIQRTIMPELRSIRVVIDRLLSGPADITVPFGDGLHLAPSLVSASYIKLNTTPATLDRQVRVSFAAGQYSSVNLASIRSIFIEYWLAADAGGGSPEVSLFNEATAIEISGSSAIHTAGTTTARYVRGPLEVGTDADQLPEEDTVYVIEGRDTSVLVKPVLEQARFLVVY